MRSTAIRMLSAAVVVALVGLPTAAEAVPPQGLDAQRSAAKADATLTLITGDLVRLPSVGAGVSVRSADGEATDRAEFVGPDGHRHVWPTAVISLIGDRLDSRLFDVTELLELGLGDASGRDLPLLVEHAEGAQLPGGMKLVESLDADGTWEVTVGASDRPAVGAALRDAAAGGDGLTGIESIRLDDSAAGADPATETPAASSEAAHTLTVGLAPHEAGGDFAGVLWVEPIGRVEAYEYVAVDQDQPTVELEVEAGTYHLTFQSEQTINGVPALVDVSTNDLAVDGDTTVRLDGATATDITVDAGRPVERRDGLIGGLLAPEPNSNELSYSMQVNGADGLRLLVAPTDAPVGGEHEFVTIQTLLSDGPSYHLVHVEADGVPAGLTYTTQPAELAEIEHAMHADVTGRDYLVRSLGYAPDGFETYVEGSTYAVPAGTAHTAWTTPELWNFVVFAGGEEGVAGLLEPRDEPWPAGEKTVLAWFSPVVRAGTSPDRALAYQFDDFIGFDVYSFVDGGGNTSFYWYDDVPALDTTTYEITVGGEVVLAGEGDLSGVTVPIASDPVEVEVQLDVARDAPWWLSSPSTSTHWQFTSEPRGEPSEPVYPAMLQVDYELPTDLSNRATTPATIGFHPYQPGAAPLGIPISSLSAWTSTDAGASWDELAVDDLGNGDYVGQVDADPTCADPCRVSLRTLAVDTAGNSVDQTVTDAFVLGIAAPTAPPTATPTVAPTLPMTGGGATTGVALTTGVLAMLLGGLLVFTARRRLRAPVR